MTDIIDNLVKNSYLGGMLHTLLSSFLLGCHNFFDIAFMSTTA